MTRELTAFEVLKIAEQMEQNAACFYRRAAGMYDDPALSKLFSELAQWEKRHGQVFAQMKDQSPEQAWEQGSSDPERVDVSRLDVPPAVFDEHSDPAKELIGRETRAEVFTLALKKERYTTGYYTSLTEFALGPENIKVIKNILQEEKKHVRILVQSLRQTIGWRLEFAAGEIRGHHEPAVGRDSGQDGRMVRPAGRRGSIRWWPCDHHSRGIRLSRRTVLAGH